MLYLSLISLDPLQPCYSDEVDGWTDEALVTLCQLHKDDLDRFNSVHGVQKGAHWADIAQQMNSMGFTGPWFSSGKQVSMKWRYMLCQYKIKIAKIAHEVKIKLPRFNQGMKVYLLNEMQ